MVQQARTPQELESLARRAVALEPEDLSYRVQFAACLVRSRKYAEALSIVGSIEFNIEDPKLLAALGGVCSSSQDQEGAERLFKKAIAADKENAELIFNLAAVQRYLGKSDESDANFTRVIELQPHHYEAWYGRSNLRKQTPNNNHITALNKLITAGVTNWRGEVMLRYALGKELEDIGEWQLSFESYQAGATLHRQRTRYDPVAERQTMQQIINHHTREALTSVKAGLAVSGAIFVVGLPRTGTTLVERILAAHSSVSSLGELADFASSIVQIAKSEASGSPVGRDQLVKLSANFDPHVLGSTYLQKVNRIPRSTPQFVDKMPLNFLYLGLIFKALPDAKIVHVVRDPMDSCFAIFKTLFKGVYPWSYDLEELAEYYIAHHRLMQHWYAHFPARIHQVCYEELIRDQEGVSRDLIQACGLEWEPDCLDFHQLKTASTTASAVQVREPVYTSSIGKWKKFERELELLSGKLLTAGVPI